MSRRKTFLNAWKTRFPTDDPPDLQYQLDSLEGDRSTSDVTATLQEALKEHETKVKQLQKQLYQSEFIVSFLWEILREYDGGEKSTATLDGVDLEDSESSQEVFAANDTEDNKPSELPSDSTDQTDGVVVSVKRKESVRDLVNNFEKHEETPIAKPVNKPLAALEQEEGIDLSHTTGNFVLSSIKKKKKPPLTKTLSDPSPEVKPKPIPAPRPSKRGPVFITQRHSAVPLTESVAEESTDSPERPPPRPAPPLLQLEQGSNTVVDKPKMSEPSPTENSQNSPEVSQSPQGSSNGEIPGPKARPPRLVPLRSSKTKFKGNHSPSTGSTGQSASTSDSEQPQSPGPAVMKRSRAPYDNVTIPISPSRVGDSDDDEVIYDEPVPVSKSDAESDSTSEDEDPIYYNILLMKHQSMNHVSMNAEAIYASVDIQKKKLEQRAKRLSTRFSSSDEEGQTKNSQGSFMPSVPEDGQVGQNFVHFDVVGESSDHDSVFPPTPEKTPHAIEDFNLWKKRQSMMYAMKGDDSMSDGDDLDVMVPSCAEAEKWQMRKWVVTSILDSEQNYVGVLDVVLQYMKTFRAVADTPRSVINTEDIDIIFAGIPDLHQIHMEFVHDLEPRVKSWTPEQSIAESFKILALKEYPIATEYLKNYQKALQTLHRCCQDNAEFLELVKEIPCHGMKEKPSLEELLHKPVVRFQRNTLVLHDLIKCTPASHGDYDLLQKTLKIAQNFLDNFQAPLDKDCAENQRYLAKQSLIVERLGTHSNGRKLRHIFLFNDVIVCCKQRISGRQKLHYDVKWYIPLVDLVIIDKKFAQAEERQMAETHRREVETLQHKVRGLQTELKSELKKARGAQELQRNWSLRGHNKNVEKLKKKLVEQEAQLLLASPHLILKLRSTRQDKNHVFLMSSDYERSSWSDTILGLQNRAKTANAGLGYSTVELQNSINSLKLTKVSALGSIFDREDLMLGEDYLFGSLNVTIHRLQGLKEKSDVHCCLEVDSFGHFFIKAKTNTVSQLTEPSWDEDFEIDLEGAQTLRILCYSNNDTLLGKCALELSKAWLRGDFSENSVSLNEDMSIVVSLRYVTRDQTLKRTPSAAKSGLFGVRINHITKRENTQIPLIVTTCIEQVEKRGLEDLGIYRVSGLSSEIQKLRKAFEKSSIGAKEWTQEADINVVTGLLKLYLRELPEALFTDKLYPPFIEGIGLADPEAKEKCMQSLFKSLPQPNRATAVYIIDHLVKVSKKEDKNKMTLHNLATVFGPTLLRPAITEPQPMSMELFSAGARDAMLQTGILLFFLNLRNQGISLS